MKLFGNPVLKGRFWRILPWIIGILCTLLLWQFIRTRRPLPMPNTSFYYSNNINLIL
jgi:hypothetical protein